MEQVTSKKTNLIHEFYYYRGLFNVSHFFFQTFFSILLFRQTGNISIIIIDSALFYFGLWAGFMFGSFYMEKIGYTITYRLSFFLQIISAIIIAYSIPSIGLLYPILTVFRGLGRGIFWSVNHTYVLREFNDREKDHAVSQATALTLVMDVIFPIIIGIMIDYTQSYQFIYLTGALLLSLSMFIKFKYNKRPETKITSQEIISILKTPKFTKYAIFTTMNDITNIVMAFVYGILPFLFIRDEGGVGALVSLINLAGAIIAFSQRKADVTKSSGVSKWGYPLLFLASIIFLTNWSFEGMSIAILLIIISTTLRIPLQEKLDLRIKEHILGSKKNQSSVEMNMVMETVCFIGRAIAFSSILVGYLLTKDINIVFKVFIFILPFWALIYIINLKKFLKNSHTIVNN